MTITEQLAWLDRWMYFHQEAKTQAALIAIKESLQYLAALEMPIEGEERKAKYDHYQEFIAIYHAFCEDFIKAKSKMNSRQGKAMKSIIAYLLKQDKVKNEMDALASWEYILRHWKNLSKFIQGQTTLVQIDRNLLEILTQLRNGHDKKSSKIAKSNSIKQRIAQRNT